MKRTALALLAAAAAVPALALSVALAPTATHADPPSGAIVGTLGDDVLIGTNHTDLILGRLGDDVLVGKRKADALVAGNGRDLIRAAGRHSGTDLARGGKGFDRCIVGTNDVWLGCELVVVR